MQLFFLFHMPVKKHFKYNVTTTKWLIPYQNADLG